MIFGIDINTIVNIGGILIGICVAIKGWDYNNKQQSKRDRRNRANDIKIKTLANAFKGISIYNTRNNNGKEDSESYREYEKSIQDIQIFGSEKEIKLLQEYINNLGTKGYSLDPLLKEIRGNLREILELENIDRHSIYWVIDKNI